MESRNGKWKEFWDIEHKKGNFDRILESQFINKSSLTKKKSK